MTDRHENLVDALIKDPLRVKPEFIREPDMDKLVAVVLRLAMECGVLRDRIARQEQLLKAQGVLSARDYENYEPDEETLKQSQTESFDLVRAIAKDLG